MRTASEYAEVPDLNPGIFKIEGIDSIDTESLAPNPSSIKDELDPAQPSLDELLADPEMNPPNSLVKIEAKDVEINNLLNIPKPVIPPLQ